MRLIFVIPFLLTAVVSFAQQVATNTFKTDSLLVVSASPQKGFHHDYLLFIPKGTPVITKLKHKHFSKGLSDKNIHNLLA